MGKGVKSKKKGCSNCLNLVEYQNKDRPEYCPFCNEKYWWKPHDERILFILQDNYYRHDRDEKYLEGMYNCLIQYAHNLILNKVKNRFLMPYDHLEEAETEIANSIISRYLKDKTFFIHSSFGGLMSHIANGVLFGIKQQKHDKVISLNAFVEEHGGELIDNLDYFGNYAIIGQPERDDIHEFETFMADRYFNLDIVTDFMKLLQDILDGGRERIEPKELILFLSGIRHLICKTSKDHISNWYTYVGRDIKHYTKETELVLFEKLRSYVER